MQSNSCKDNRFTDKKEDVEMPNLDFLLKKADDYLSFQRYEKAEELYNKMLIFYPENSRAHWGKLLVELRCKNDEELMHCNVEVSQITNYKNAIRYANPEQKQRYEKIEHAISQRKPVKV